MDRTDLFRKEVQNCKRKAGIALQTDDIIQPKVDVHPSLRRAFVIVPPFVSFHALVQQRTDVNSMHRRLLASEKGVGFLPAVPDL